MARTTQIKTTFTAGEVSVDLLGRGDLRAYENGALRLRNVFIQPTGGVKRRSGLRYLDEVSGTGRLLACRNILESLGKNIYSLFGREITDCTDVKISSHSPVPVES
ncbi:MAG TPA: hypothetical protein PLK94_12250, partial [Alphaproteobacteria bacterium]|nr:hypothetical protein [Alphaproteobacteria bacterium]